MTKSTRTVLVVLLLSIGALPAAAFELHGTVVDEISGRPLAQVDVTLLGPGDETLGAIRSDAQGRFSFVDISPDTVRVAASCADHEEVTTQAIILGEEQPADLLIRLPRAAYQLEVVVVTASRTTETGLDAPASVTVVEPEDIAIRQDFLPTDALRSVTGVRHARKGLLSSTYNIRGPAGVTNGITLLMQDWRNTRLPAFVYNLPYVMAATPADIERIEVIRGPAGVLYGPEAGAGVVHVFTRSPLDHQGTSISVGAGNRSVLETWGRHSGRISDRVGYGMTLRYLSGEDWIPTDPNVVVDSPLDFTQLNGQASVEWRPGGEDRLILTAGQARTQDLFEQFPAFYVEFDEFRNSFLQARYHRRQAMVNFVVNENRTTDGYSVPGDLPIVENSRVYIGQAQDGRTLELGGMTHRTSYGLDWRTTNVRTDGTLTGRYEDNDTVTEVGGFFHTASSVSSRLELLGAIRVDYHDRLATGFAFPFRIGSTFKPADDHALRVTASRQTNVGGPGFMFQDMPLPGPGYPFQNRLISTPASGWNFQRDATGRLRMRSAYVPGGLDVFGAADATRTWQTWQSQFPVLADVPAPDADQVGTVLRTLNLNTGGFDVVAPDDVTDISQVDREYSNRLEFGYKGFVSNRLSMDVTVYGARYENVITALAAQTPNVFFEPTSLEAYLEGYLSGEQAQDIAEQLARERVGTVAPAEIGASSEIIVGNTQGGTVTQWGTDIGVDFWAFDGWLLRANYSWAPPGTHDLGPGRISPQAVPRHRGLLALAYRPDREGLTGLAEVRGQTDYEMAVGSYSGTVAGYAVIDLSLGYRFPGKTGLSVFLTGTNILDKRYVEIIGAKELGRLVMLRTQLDF